MSVRWSYAYFLIISGLRYRGVPTCFDLIWDVVFTMVLSLRSPSLNCLSFVINILPGFTSRWMISCEWQCKRASVNYQATDHISFSEKYLPLVFWLLINCCISPSSAYSIAIYSEIPDDPDFYNCCNWDIFMF